MSLKDFKKDRPNSVLPFCEACVYFLQIVDAVTLAHNLKIFHNDIISANVLMYSDGQNHYAARLCDWEYARISCSEFVLLTFCFLVAFFLYRIK